MKSHIIYLSCAAFILMMAISCKKETPSIPATGLTLSKTDLLINAGFTDTLTANINPANATNQDVTWVSSDTNIVRVNSSGIIEGVAPGVATITATTADGDYSAACSVNTIKWTIYNTHNGLSDNQVFCIAIDSTGSLWFGGSSVSKFDGSAWYTYLADLGVGSIDVDADKNIWFGTFGFGVYKYDGFSWTLYDTSNCGITDNSINTNTIDVDSQGDIWFGTHSRVTWAGTGVSKFDGANWKTYNSDNGLVYNNVWDIETDAQGNEWFVTSHGISEFDGNNWTSYTSATTGNELVDIAYNIAIDGHGNKWFGTSLGLLKFDGTNWTTFTTSNSGLVSSQVNAIAFDKGGNAWIGTYGGVSKFDGTNWTSYSYNSGLASGVVLSIVIDPKGDKWFGTVDGVFKLED
jgi:hypothetical protein